jgi:ABC-type uncharacterized transport system substrate-binding protein
MIPKILVCLTATLLLIGSSPANTQQAKKIPRIAYLGIGSSLNPGPQPGSDALVRLGGLRRGLQELGYEEGKNIIIEYRTAAGQRDRIPGIVAELARLKIDVIVWAAVQEEAKQVKAIPIIYVGTSDFVATGLVNSLARPGGNITGFSGLSEELGGKRVALLKEAVPKISRVAVLAVSQTPAQSNMWIQIQGVAKTLTMTSERQEVAGPDEIEHAFARLVKGRAQGLIVLPHAVTSARRTQIVGLAAKHRLPGMYPDGQYVEAGGLMSYSANLSDLHRRAATYVDISKHAGRVKSARVLV